MNQVLVRICSSFRCNVSTQTMFSALMENYDKEMWRQCFFLKHILFECQVSRWFYSGHCIIYTQLVRRSRTVF